MERRSDGGSWYSVRCIFRWLGPPTYEERITIWQGSSLDEAIELAESEAHSYAELTGSEFLGLSQAYEISDGPMTGAEVFSLLRESDLEPDAYLDAFFDTGTERQTESGEGG